ncbi:MAG: class A beta-lactamase-related serine hydrolase [Chloroflexi bacterium]|nr:class A beta-lactamase-related serine hydrolase [Chloroflexota bacterium]
MQNEKRKTKISELTEDAIANELNRLTCSYAFYYHRRNGVRAPILRRNCDLFLAASIIKVPILFAWAYLERMGRANRAEVCELDFEPQIEGAGLSWLLKTRRLPFNDVLLLMIALSDNLCTNLVIRRIGIERLNGIFRGPLGLPDAVVERKLMDYEARARGLENRVSVADCIRLFELRDGRNPEERAWIEPMLLASDDMGLLLRNVPRDTVAFYHKTGSIPGLLHDWGYTGQADVFLLTQNVKDVGTTYEVFGRVGEMVLRDT